MNSDTSLSFIDRWNLVVSNPDCQREFNRLKFQINPFKLVKQTGCYREECKKNKGAAGEGKGRKVSKKQGE